jgi:hypothetical protein
MVVCFQDVGMYAEAESCFKLLICTRNKIIALECLEKIKESTAFFHHLKPIVQEPPLKIVDARYPGVPVYITDMAYKPQAQTSTSKFTHTAWARSNCCFSISNILNNLHPSICSDFLSSSTGSHSPRPGVCGAITRE